ncbi:MAG: T9SS type A sorting domain-containing protein [Bacteroidota bacterium]
MKNKLPLLILLASLKALLSDAQLFTDLHSGFPTLTGASTAWADYDNDGLPDFALIGFSGVTAELSQIYHNDGGGTFSIAYVMFFKVSSGAVSWGDYDHDGDFDLMLNGQNGGGGPVAVTTIARNDGAGLFIEITGTIPGVIGVTRWIDYDGDGWLDVLSCGLGASLTADSTRLFHNNMNGTFTEIPSNLPGYQASDISIVDFDNDSDMDFFITGGTISATTFPVTKLYQNDGIGNFTEVPFAFANLSTGTSKWADYDNDGDMDVLYDGIDSTFGMGITLLYRNDNAGNFTLITTNLPGSGEPGSVDWADIDNDGDLDILLGNPMALLRNDGGNIYTDISQIDFPESVPNSFSDIDNDGDPDILFVGTNGGFNSSTIFRNENVNAIDQISNQIDFAVSPNPTIDKFMISFTSVQNQIIEIKIIDVFGQDVFYSKVENTSHQIVFNSTTFSKGVYFVKVSDGKKLLIKKLIIN